MKNLFLLMLFAAMTLLLFPPVLYAQTDFQPGFILTSTGDTLKGWIGVRNIGASQRECLFKKESSAQAARYLPSQLKAYWLQQGDYFVAKQVPDKKELFLRCLVQGAASLYSFTDTLDVEFFYVEKKTDGKLNELPRGKTLIYKNGEKLMQQDTRYIGVLTYLFNDCASLREQIKKLKPTVSEFVNIVQSYNRCKNDAAATFAPGISRSTRFGLISGMSFTSLSFAEYPVLLEQRPGSRQPLLGGFVNLRLSSLVDKYNLQIEAFYMRTAYKGKVTGSNREFTMNVSHLRVPVLFRYTYLKGKVTPFVNAGVFTNLVLSNSEKSFSNVSRFNPGLLVGAGSYFRLGTGKALFVEGRLDKESGIFKSLFNGNRNSIFHLLLGMQF